MDPFLAVIVSGVAMFAAHILFILLFRTKPTPAVKVAKVGDPAAPVDAGGAEAPEPDSVCLLYTSPSPRD